MTTLDCSSVDTAIASLAELFGMRGAELTARIRDCQINWHHRSIAPENQILVPFGYSDVDELPSPHIVRWFHATRAPYGTAFEEGLLPTSCALPKLWATLGVIAAQWSSPEEWEAYQRSFNRGDRLYSGQFFSKRVAPSWEGPFAFLVKQAALHQQDRPHKDFTRICETLEDICADYEEVFHRPLRQAYEAATRPCIVVFVASTDYPGGAVRAALNYVHRSLAGLEQGIDSNTNYNGKGRTVPRCAIEAVEWL